MGRHRSTQCFVLQSREFELWARYSRYIYKLCLRKCRDFEKAQDFYQEIYIKYHLHAANVANHSKPGLWFKRVVENAWNSKLREQLHGFSIVSWECHEDTAAYNLVDDSDNEDSLNPFLNFIETCELLNSLERMLFEYLYIGFSLKELSEILGLSVRSLRKKFRKAAERLESAGLLNKILP